MVSVSITCSANQNILSGSSWSEHNSWQSPADGIFEPSKIKDVFLLLISEEHPTKYIVTVLMFENLLILNLLGF